jgi:hypothetical protein
MRRHRDSGCSSQQFIILLRRCLDSIIMALDIVNLWWFQIVNSATNLLEKVLVMRAGTL